MLKEYIEIPPYKESLRERFLREVIHTARLVFNSKNEKNPSILSFRKKSHSSLKLKLFYAVVSLAAKRVKNYENILKKEVAYNNALRTNEFYSQMQTLLKEAAPDVIFCTHQRALKAPTVFAAAQDLGILTTTVIYSWDNIPKARLALKADKYLVWSQYMKHELERMYPEVDSEKVVITGTPQFEFYKDPANLMERSEFFKTYGLDPQKKLICFSGDDIKTSPYDPHYLHDLAKGLVNGGLDNTHQIVFRRCPVDLSGRYDWVVSKFPQLIVEVPPLWNYNSSKWTAVYPTFGDVKLLVSLAYHCEVVLNVGSTMAFDFGMFNKPCIYINYDHVKDRNWSVETIYNYQHFRSMPSEKAVYWLNSKQDVSKVLIAAMDGSGTTIQNWFSVVVEHPSLASEKIIKELL